MRAKTARKVALWLLSEIALIALALAVALVTTVLVAVLRYNLWPPS